jgi:hypothetical protein
MCGADVAERVDHGVHVRCREHSLRPCAVDLCLCSPALGLRLVNRLDHRFRVNPAAIAAW